MPEAASVRGGVIRPDHSAFVGRVAELDALRSAHQRTVASSRPTSLTVVGDPGIGKSTLVRRLLSSLATSDLPPLVRRGRCLAYGRGITYAPMAEVLREHLALGADEPPDAIRARLADREILGLTLGLLPAGDLHPLAARNRLHDAWVALLEEAARERPVILLVEDVQWAEEPLLELLEQCATEVRGPLMVLTTARPEFAQSHSEWLAARHHTLTIWLDPLAAEDAESLVAALVDEGAVPLAPEIIERADGNPLFLEELISAAADVRLLPIQDGGRAIQAPTVAPVPDSIRAVLAARLDVLAASDRSTLQAASIVGRSFGADAVGELLGTPSVELTALLRRDFVRRLERGAPENEAAYTFKHSLVREVAYASIPKSRRARLHAAYAARLERIGGGRDEDAPLLAHHYAEAVRPGDADLAWRDEPTAAAALRAKTRTWLARAAELAVRRYAIDETIALLERALTLDPSTEEAPALWLAVGRANVLRYDGIGFWTAMERAVDASSSDEQRAAIYSELAFETAFRWAIWKQMPARELVDGWIARALVLAPPASKARVNALVASAYWRPDGSGGAAAEALAIAEKLDDPVLMSYALDVRALAAFVSGDDLRARSLWERRTGLAGAITDLDHLEDLYGSAITGCVALGEFVEARRFAQLHDEVAMQLSSHHRVHAVAMHLELEELAGDWPRIVALTPRAETAIRANAATPCVRNERSLLTCAVAAAHLGDWADAERLEAAADAQAMEGYDAVFDPLRVRLAMLRGDLPAVRRHLPSRMPPPSKNWWRLTTKAARLDALLALGDLETARRESEALAVPGTFLEPFAERTLGVALGDRDRIARAAARFDELGVTWHAAETRRLAG